MRKAWIGLGANLGEPEAQVLRAFRWLAAIPGLEVEARSRLRTTAPEGPPQPSYVNAACRVRTTLSPCALLDVLRSLETAAGRRRRPGAERNAPRPLDLDLLLYEDRVLRLPELTLPHPRVHLRRFVLEPLADLDPDLVHPVLRRSVSDLLAALPPFGA